MTEQFTTDNKRYSLLGVELDAVTIPEVLQTFEQVIDSDRHNIVIGNHNLHSIYLFQRDARMRQFYDLPGITYIDSMPLIFLGKMLGLPLDRKNRTAFLDWYQDFLMMAEAKDWRIYYVGGRSESIDRASIWMRTHYPKLSIRFHHGFFSDHERAAIYEDIRNYGPQVLLVGMGMPRQEDFILSACENIRTNAIVNGGAMMEYMIGEQTAAPRWMGQLGLEWLFRLATQPRRLAYRYLIEPLVLIRPLARDLQAAWIGPGVRNPVNRQASMKPEKRKALAKSAS